MAFVNLLQAIYPVGSVYISATNISPANTIGGTWQQVTDKYLYATTAPASIGGSSSHSHSLSKNGGACIDVIGKKGSGSTYWLNFLTVATSLVFSPQYANAYLVDRQNDSTETGQHAVALIGNTDTTTYQPIYYGICMWIRTA